jgi:hypothetical protein
MMHSTLANGRQYVRFVVGAINPHGVRPGIRAVTIALTRPRSQ